MNHRWQRRRLSGAGASPRGRRRRDLGPRLEVLEERAQPSLGFSFAAEAGGNANTNQSIQSTGVAIDAAGDTYVSGWYSGDVNFGGNHRVPATGESAGTDAFVAKYNPGGSLAWVRTAGGSLDDRATGVAVDSSGNVYVAGFYTASAKFGLESNSPPTLSDGGNGVDIFVWKLGSDGSTTWVQGTTSSSSTFGPGPGIAVDGTGTHIGITAYITPASVNSSGSVKFGTTTLSSAVNTPIVAELNGSGAPPSFAWAKVLKMTAAAGTVPSGMGYQVAVDSAGDVYATGTFFGAIQLNPADSTSTHNSMGGSDAYLVKLDSGGAFVWGEAYGGTSNDFGAGVAVDPAGNVTLAAPYTGTVDFDPNANHPGNPDVLTSPSGSFNYAVLHLDPSGKFLWVKNLGTNSTAFDVSTSQGRDVAQVAVNNQGQIAVATIFRGSASPVGTPARNYGGQDVLIAMLNGSGQVLDVATAGGPNDETANGVALNPSGLVAATGLFPGTPKIVNGQTTYTGTATLGTKSLSTSNVANIFVAGLQVINPNPTPNPNPNPAAILNLADFNGDGKSDPAVLDLSLAIYFAAAPNIDPVHQFGTFTTAADETAKRFVPLSGDFDGDGKTDYAAYSQTIGAFYIAYSSGARPGLLNPLLPFGDPTHLNIPVAGDFDGDGKSDPAIFDATNDSFTYIASSTATAANPFGTKATTQIGSPTDNSAHFIPLAGDFDGDGKTDIAVYSLTHSVIYFVHYSGGGAGFKGGVAIGIPGDTTIPIVGDFNGDGRADPAVYDLTQHTYYIVPYSNFNAPPPGGSIPPQVYGTGPFQPAIGDYNGDGKADYAGYTQPTLTFSYQPIDAVPPGTGGLTIKPFGNSTDAFLTVPGTYVPPTFQARAFGGPSGFEPLSAAIAAPVATLPGSSPASTSAAGPVIVATTPPVQPTSGASASKTVVLNLPTAGQGWASTRLRVIAQRWQAHELALSAFWARRHHA